MIIINQKKNLKLLQTFNNDPYSNIEIKCQNQLMNLSLSYLSIDSQFFDEVDMDSSSINLSQFPEKPLIKILRSLYGEQLKTCSVKQLEQLYKIILFLKINQYQKNIVDSIRNSQKLINDLEIVEFCFNQNILTQEIKKYHFQRNLAMLSESKNYLKLDKITLNNLSELLIQYAQEYADKKETDQTLNSIMENYFGRNSIKANQYFNTQAINDNPKLTLLQTIWEKFHHSISYLINAKQVIKQSQIFNQNTGYNNNFGNTSLSKGMSQDMMASQNGYMSITSPNNYGLNKSPSFYNSNNSIGFGMAKTNEEPRRSYMSNSIITSNVSQQIGKKDLIIADLQRELQLKNQIIFNLKKEIESCQIEQKKTLTPRKQGTPNNRILKNQQLLQSDDLNNIDQSILQDVKKSRKNLVVPVNGQYDTSMIEPAFDQVRKVNTQQQKEVKTMSKLNSRGTKRIFS